MRVHCVIRILRVAINCFTAKDAKTGPSGFTNVAKMSILRFEKRMKIRFILACFLLASVAVAQDSQPNAAPSTPVSYNSASELNSLLTQLQQTAQSVQLDLASLRIEKWKTDANTKQSTATDVSSIQRNLKEALPEITNRLKNSPESLPTTFELYRNLDALYEVFSSVVESAGAFGTRDEYQTLQTDLGAMQKSRRSFADRMDKLAGSKEAEILNLRTQLQKAQVAQEATPPKKTVIDDTDDQAKKPVTKKKPVAKKPKPSAPNPVQPAQGQSSDGTQAQPAQNPPSNPQ